MNKIQPKPMKTALLLALTLLISTAAVAQPPAAKPADDKKPDASKLLDPQMDKPPMVTQHTSRAGNKTLTYTTTTGFMPIKNPQTGETEAHIFYIAYTLDNPPANRPLMFSFNGGPGSASVWLHLGALGPKRVKMLNDGAYPPPPFEMEDNAATWLADTDLVFIDPVGTGYSRPTKEEYGKKFFGLRGDIASVGEFIRLYLGKNERWMSPLFLVGESYGTTRASGLSNWLFDHGIALNGIVLVSTVMNFQTLDFASNNDLPLVLILPSYATTAWYHKRLSPPLQAKPVAEIAEMARKFAANEYLPAMMRIDQLSPTERDALADKFASMTGLTRDFVIRNNFRVELGEFNKELLRDQRRSTGRLDGRLIGIDTDAAGDGPDRDPSMSAIRPPYTAAFNSYVRRDLGFKSDMEYYILGGGIGRWDFSSDNSYADTSSALRSAMAKNPYMKIMIAAGYFDMATPFYAAEYTVSAMNLDPSLRKNISFDYYESGHMMYIDVPSLMKLHNDASAFISTALKK